MKYVQIAGIVLIAVAVAVFSGAAPVLAQSSQEAACIGSGGTWSGDECVGDGGDLASVFTTVANILLFLIGAVAVIMLIVGGFRYVVSGGDSNAVEGAKNTILYAIVGIIVAFLAWAAVDFVVDSLVGGQAPTASESEE